MTKIGKILASMAMILIVMAGSIGHVAAEENTKTKITISFDMGDQKKITYHDDGISLRGGVGGGRVGGVRIGGGRVGGGKVGGVKAPSKISSPSKVNPGKNVKSGDTGNVKSANNVGEMGSIKGVNGVSQTAYRPSPLSPDYYNTRRFDTPAPSHSFFGPIPWWYYPIFFHSSGSHNTGGNAAYNQSLNSSRK